MIPFNVDIMLHQVVVVEVVIVHRVGVRMVAVEDASKKEYICLKN
jgi:hypothetical protein